MSDQKTAAELFGDQTPPANTRDRLIETALDLFFQHGIHAVGLDRIIAAVGVTKTTFYNHFDSKESLIQAAIEKRDAWELRTYTEHLHEKAGDDPKQTLIALFDVLDQWFNHPDYRGCLFVNACAEFPSPHDPIHKSAASHYSRVRDAVSDIARQAGVTEADQLAAQLTLLIEGALTFRQITGDNNAAKIAKEMAACAIQRSLVEQA